MGIVNSQGNCGKIAQLINQARKQQYQKVATETNIPLSEVVKRAGSKAQEKTPAGQYIKQ